MHPYDDPDVIAGQGTIGMEILRQCQGPLDAIFVAVGGGGLIAGIAAYIKRVRPDDQDHRRAAGRLRRDDALARRRAPRRRCRTSGLFADGVAVKQVGRETFRLARAYVDEMITVDTDATCAAIKDVFEDTRSILEPAGALSVAGVKAWCERHRARDRTFVAIACGANMNFDRLRFVAERAELGEAREAIFAVTIPERPGSFREFCGAARQPQRHRVQLSVRGREASRISSSASRSPDRRATAELLGVVPQAPHRGLRPVRQRDGEAARAPPGRRPRAGGRRTRSSTASSSPSGPAR